jgi:amino acid adenylation domain-containing protein
MSSSSFPLSSPQTFAWLRLRHPAGRDAHRARAVRLRGTLDVPALQDAFAELGRRHAALRVCLGGKPDQLAQSIVAERPLVLRRARAASDALGAALGSEIATAFDLAHDALVRALLVEVSDRESVLVVTGHPLAVDRTAIELLFEELSTLYARSSRGTADDAAWQNALRIDDADANYWRQLLAGAPGVLELPIESWRGANGTFERHALPIVAAGAWTQETVTAAVAALLARYTGEPTVLIGCPIDARGALGAQRMIGAFEWPALLAVDVSGNPTFAALIERVRTARRDAIEHSRIGPQSFADAITATNAPGNFRPPQVRLALADAFAPWQLNGIETSDLELPWTTTPEPLTFALALHRDRIDGHVVFDPGLLSPDLAGRTVEHLIQLLQAGSARPDCSLRRLTLLGRAEIQQVVADMNAATAPLPDTCVHHLFEQQVERTPDATAVCDKDVAVTYRELNDRANRLARWMVRAGVGPERTVVVCLRPGIDTIAALYATLKAGGTYVPLDPDGPLDRLRFMVADATPALVLAEPALVATFASANARVVTLDACMREVERESIEALPPRANADNLAYVIYTSGSTGEPKGVQVSHRSVVNHNLAVARRFHLGSSDRLLQFTPINFDAAGEEIYPPLLSGSAIIILGELTPVHTFRAFVERERLTVLSLPPAYLQQWVRELEHAGESVPACLRLVLLGGEKLLPVTLAGWRRVGGGQVPWINVYGPTEATVTSAMCEIAGDALPRGATLPIGGPVDNAQLYLLDTAMELVPFGHAGELYIGGAGVARGYVGRPDMTADRFLPDPYSGRPGARLYRTGDIARHLPDGRLEFVGRADQQVKIRGFRVELGEVEATLRRQPGIADTVVVVRDDGHGGRLVAYVVAVAGFGLALDVLKGDLRQALPDYMVPSDLVVLDALPLTPGGKVDRKALPAPGPAHVPASRPMTEMETSLATVWRDVLGMDVVGPNDDFFDLGGQSLTAMQVIARISDTLGLEVELQDVFDHPTIAALATRLESLAGAVDASVDAMSDEEVERKLAELLARQGARD